ncbi:MAG: fibrobacter succinogenes major paralogous domain-containing protein [Gemmatimonadetes bacterium]|nr:fibrobacter succinogenes major paralogous domain-containing protein [Gemmatimonadota bacterium]
MSSPVPVLVLSIVVLRSSIPPVTGGQEAPLRDIDGNVYPQVEIGARTWMAENLRVTRYSDGEPLSFSTYPDSIDSRESFGLLYDWAAATRGIGSSAGREPGIQGLCPIGWRLPSEADWEDLVNAMGGASVAGRAAKAPGHWGTPLSQRASATGFNALPAGFQDFTGVFLDRGVGTFFLASTWAGEGPVTAFALETTSSEFRKVRLHPRDRVSVRCLKRERGEPAS